MRGVVLAESLPGDPDGQGVCPLPILLAGLFALFVFEPSLMAPAGLDRWPNSQIFSSSRSMSGGFAVCLLPALIQSRAGAWPVSFVPHQPVPFLP